MTISSAISKNQYTGNGSNTVFAYTFKIFEEGDIAVLEGDTTKTITTHYTVSGVGSDSGGNITFVTAPGNGVIVTLKRAEPLLQSIDYPENDDFPSIAHEEGLDRSVIRDQFLQEQIDRAILLSEGSIASGITFPDPTDDMNKFLRVNATEDGYDHYDIANLGAVAVPVGDIVGTTDSQTLSNKTISGATLTGATANSGTITGGTYAGAATLTGAWTLSGQNFVGTSAAAGTHITYLADTVRSCVEFFQGADGTALNAANAMMKIRSTAGTGRSINAAGTINASGADYAEYETKRDDCGVVVKGDIVGFDANGLITDKWDLSVSFAVKSTNPNLVGGDAWHKGLDGDELEVERQKVDRIAYCGKVPVNVMGANAGEYIEARESDGGIIGVAVSNPSDFSIVVGRVRRILDDGRAEIVVRV